MLASPKTIHYVQYKSLLPKDAPGSAFRRFNSNTFWEDLLPEYTLNEQPGKAKTISKDFQDSVLVLLEVSVSKIQKHLRSATGEEGESSASASVDNNTSDYGAS